MRFAMVTTFFPPYNFGGDGMYIYRLSNALAEQGHSVDIFHCEDAYLLLNRKLPSGDFPNHPNITVHGLKSKSGFLSPLLTQQTGVPFFKGKLKDYLVTENFDVIHYHNMSLIGITALSYGTGIKLYTTHEHWLVCPMHVLWKYNREICTKKSCFTCQISGKRPPQLWRHTGLLEKMLKHVDCFISPSRFTLNKHLELGLDIPIKHIPYFLANSGIEKDREIQHVSQDKPYFLFVGRLEKIKGVQNLIPVFSENPDYELLVAGEGEYGNELKEKAKGRSNIKFLGRLEQKKLMELYASAVAVIVPSICYETFGIIIIEAFSRKTPVIVNKLGALPEVVEDSDGGIIYETPDELRSAINLLAKNRELRNQLAKSGYEAYLKFWTREAHLNQYMSTIDSLLKEKKVLN